MAPRRPLAARDRRRRVRNGAIAAGAFAALLLIGYAVVSPIAVPWLVRRMLERHTAATDDRAITVGTLEFEPFMLAFEAADVGGSVGSAENGRTTYFVERVRIDFAALTLLQSQPLLDEVTIVEPRIEIEANGESAASLGAALRQLATSARFDRFTVERGAAAVFADDRSSWLLEGIGIDARSLDISNKTGRFEIAVDDFLGSALDVDGAISGEAAEGRLAIRNLDLGRFARRLGAGFGAPSGVLDLAGDLDARLARGVPTVRLASGVAALRGVSLEPPEEPTDAQHADAAISATLSLEGARLDIEAHATLAAGGTVSFDAATTDSPVGARTARIRFADLPASAFAAYARHTLGSELSTGRIGGDIAFTIDDALVGRADLTAMDLTLSTPGIEPIGMGLALLEDASGTIAVGVPIALAQGADAPLPIAIADAVREELYAIGTAPHATLAALVGAETESLRAVEFLPGEAAPAPRSADTLAALAAALLARPKIGVTVAGVFDPETDRRALAARQVELHVLLAAAAPTQTARPQPVDFASPRAQDALDEFARERLPAEDVAAIASAFDPNSGAAPDSPARVAYYRTIFDALVAHEPIPDSALVRLGRFRVQAVAQALTDAGVGPHRIRIGNIESLLSATEEHVPLSIGLASL